MGTRLPRHKVMGTIEVAEAAGRKWLLAGNGIVWKAAVMMQHVPGAGNQGNHCYRK